MRREISFTVYGRPQPAGSKRAFAHKQTGRVLVVDDNAKSRPWKQEVANTALGVMPSRLLEGPLELEVTFVLKRPRGHYGTGRNQERLKASAPTFPIVKPDATKLLRGVEDALTGILYRDDSQIVDQLVRKRYGSVERCEIRVRALEDLVMGSEATESAA